MWLAALDGRVPKRRIVRVPVGRWSAKILGAAALTTEQRRARSIAVANARTRRTDSRAITRAITSHDEGAAVCVGLYAARSPEVGRVLPKGRGKPRLDIRPLPEGADLSEYAGIRPETLDAWRRMPKGREKR